MAATKIKVAAAIAAVLLIGAAVPTAYHYAAARPEPLTPSPPSQSASSSITPLPPLPAGTDMSVPVAGSLPKGIIAEPLAMMDLSDKRLMRPTGGELTDRPEYIKQLLSNASRLTVAGATHALLFRITRADPSPISWTFSISGSDHYGSTGTYDANTHSSYMMVVFAPSRGANTITLTVDAGDGPWTNTAVIPASATVPTKVSVDGVTLVFDPPAEQDKQTRVKVPMDRIPGGMCREFYAVDSAGQKDYYPGTTLDRNGNYVYIFPDRLSSYREFRLDSRPYTYHATYAAIPLAQAKQ